jgi:hypothetical protein
MQVSRTNFLSLTPNEVVRSLKLLHLLPDTHHIVNSIRLANPRSAFSFSVEPTSEHSLKNEGTQSLVGGSIHWLGPNIHLRPMVKPLAALSVNFSMKQI